MEVKESLKWQLLWSKNFRILKTSNNGSYFLSLLLSENLNKKGLSTTYREVKKFNFTDTITAVVNKTESTSRQEVYCSMPCLN